MHWPIFTWRQQQLYCGKRPHTPSRTTRQQSALRHHSTNYRRWRTTEVTAIIQPMSIRSTTETTKIPSAIKSMHNMNKTLLRQKTAHTISDYAATIRTPTPFNKLPAVAHHRGDRDYTADERTIDYGDHKDPERDQSMHNMNKTAITSKACSRSNVAPLQRNKETHPGRRRATQLC